MQRELCHIILLYVDPATLYSSIVVQHTYCVRALAKIHRRCVARSNVVEPRRKILHIVMVTTAVSVDVGIERMTGSRCGTYAWPACSICMHVTPASESVLVEIGVLQFPTIYGEFAKDATT